MGISSSLFYHSDPSKETLHRRITPTDEQFEEQQIRWNELANHMIPLLRDKSGCNVKSWLQGSYKFGTQIRPMKSNDEFDIDLGFYFVWEEDEEKYSYNDVRQFIYEELLNYADGNDDVKGDIEMKERCCRISYNGGFHIDTPTYHLDETVDIRLLASENNWEHSDPKAIYNWFKDLFDDKQRTVVRRQIRYLKAWSALHMEEGRRPSSILITVLAAEAAQSAILDSNDGDDTNLRIIADNIQKRLRLKHEVKNPVNQDENINRMSKEDMDDFMYKLDGLIDIASRAEGADSQMESADIWGEAFQHFFPLPETETTVILEKAGLPSLILPEIHITARSRNNAQAKPIEGINQIGPIPKNCDITFEIVNQDQIPLDATIKWVVGYFGPTVKNCTIATLGCSVFLVGFLA